MLCFVLFFTASRSSSTVNPDLNTLVAAVTFGKGKCKINVEFALKLSGILASNYREGISGKFFERIMSWLNLSLNYDHVKYVWYAGLPKAEKLFKVSAHPAVAGPEEGPRGTAPPPAPISRSGSGTAGWFV